MFVNIATSAIAVFLLFLFAFRRAGALLYAFVPLLSGLVLTFGFAYQQISSDATALDADTLALNGGFVPIRDHEAVLELDYSLQIAPWWTFQADLQEILHPGGNVVNPLNPTQAIPDAFIVGGRTTVKF